MRDSCGLEEQRARRGAEDQNDAERGYLGQESALQHSSRPVFERYKLTTSPSLASAGSSVGGASRCLSIPSSTSTNFSTLPSGVVVEAKAEARTSPSNTTSVLTCSHFPLPNRSHWSLRPSASRVAHRIFVSRCRPVMHSAQRTMACGTSRAARTAWVMVDLQVAETPWTTTVDGLGTAGCLAG